MLTWPITGGSKGSRLVPEPIDLNASGIRLFQGRLMNHDYLWFSSFEISKTAVTLPYLHNYALSYALSDFSFGVSTPVTPQYAADLARMPLYCTPAEGHGTRRIRITQNALNDLTGRTDDGPGGRNTPDLGQRIVLSPMHPEPDEEVARGFRFYCFTFNGSRPRGVARLGKKACTVRIEWKEILTPVAQFSEAVIPPTHPVNPLDVAGRVATYEPISIPPHLLLHHVAIAHDWFVLSAEHRVHVPIRVLERRQQ